MLAQMTSHGELMPLGHTFLTPMAREVEDLCGLQRNREGEGHLLQMVVIRSRIGHTRLGRDNSSGLDGQLDGSVEATGWIGQLKNEFP